MVNLTFKYINQGSRAIYEKAVKVGLYRTVIATSSLLNFSCCLLVN